jgi:hypothetical protein
LEALLKPVSQVRILPGALEFLQVSAICSGLAADLSFVWSVLGR